jgi:hypothetical protein
LVRLRGGAHDGAGEDVTPFPPAQIALARSGTDLPLAGYWTVGSFCALLNELDLYAGIELPPGFPTMFHPQGPNDIAPVAYNNRDLPLGLPVSPLKPTPALIGFQWQNDRN